MRRSASLRRLRSAVRKSTISAYWVPLLSLTNPFRLNRDISNFQNLRKRINDFSIFIAVLAYTLLACGTFASGAYRLPDTGETKCYQGISPYAEISCAGTGQDGEYNINPMSYTDNGNGTVTDNNTGLIWQKQDDGNTYDWYQASGTYNADYNPDSTNICGSLSLDGYAGWRLPTKKELIGLLDYSKLWPDPMINSTYFPNTQYSVYWTSTTAAQNTNAAWWIPFNQFNYPVIGNNPKYDPMYVRCVRGPQLSGNLHDNGNAAVTDTSTGLLWQKSDPGAMTWSAAVSYCQGLELGGRTDWRLPNIKELDSLADDTRFFPALDTTLFPGVHTDYGYWSSTSFISWDNTAYIAWYVPFFDGSRSDYNKTSSYYVRCVSGRSGFRHVNILKDYYAGVGSGAVTSQPSGINCDAANTACSAYFSLNTIVSLDPTPDTDGSIVIGWAGDGDCDDGQIAMDSDKNCIALFTLCSPSLSVRILYGTYYDSIAAAYIGAFISPYENVIEILASNQSEILDFDEDKIVTLEGGYGDNFCQFTDQPFAKTIITGTVTITSGVVTFDKIAIR